MAEATALVNAGRSWVSAQVGELWAVAKTGRPIEPELHARVRLACSYAVHSSIRAVETLATAAGTTAGQLDGPLAPLPERRAGRRSALQWSVPSRCRPPGRVLLGLDPADPGF